MRIPMPDPPILYNPHQKQPMRTCWQKGVDAFLRGEPMVPPYVNISHHGGTWGYRANRTWSDGWCAARKSSDHRKASEAGDHHARPSHSPLPDPLR